MRARRVFSLLSFFRKRPVSRLTLLVLLPITAVLLGSCIPFPLPYLATPPEIAETKNIEAYLGEHVLMKGEITGGDIYEYKDKVYTKKVEFDEIDTRPPKVIGAYAFILDKVTGNMQYTECSIECPQGWARVDDDDNNLDNSFRCALESNTIVDTGNRNYSCNFNWPQIEKLIGKLDLGVTISNDRLVAAVAAVNSYGAVSSEMVNPFGNMVFPVSSNSYNADSPSINDPLCIPGTGYWNGRFASHLSVNDPIDNFSTRNNNHIPSVDITDISAGISFSNLCISTGLQAAPTAPLSSGGYNIYNITVQRVDPLQVSSPLLDMDGFYTAVYSPQTQDTDPNFTRTLFDYGCTIGFKHKCEGKIKIGEYCNYDDDCCEGKCINNQCQHNGDDCALFGAECASECISCGDCRMLCCDGLCVRNDTGAYCRTIEEFRQTGGNDNLLVQPCKLTQSYGGGGLLGMIEETMKLVFRDLFLAIPGIGKQMEYLPFECKLESFQPESLDGLSFAYSNQHLVTNIKNGAAGAQLWGDSKRINIFAAAYHITSLTELQNGDVGAMSPDYTPGLGLFLRNNPIHFQKRPPEKPVVTGVTCDGAADICTDYNPLGKYECRITWTPSETKYISGYNVYHAEVTNSGLGPFIKLNGNPISGNSFTYSLFGHNLKSDFRVATVNYTGCQTGDSDCDGNVDPSCQAGDSDCDPKGFDSMGKGLCEVNVVAPGGSEPPPSPRVLFCDCMYCACQ